MWNFISISTLSQVQYVSGIIQIVALVLVEILYIHADRTLAKKNHFIDVKILESLKRSSTEWVYIIGPTEAELSLTILTGSVALSCIAIPIFYVKFNCKKLFCKEKLNCIYYLYDKNDAKVAISERLDHYIELLIMSNRNHTRRLNYLTFNVESKIRELHNELSFLQYLKRNKNPIWPQNRDDANWIKRTKRLFLMLYLANFIAYFIICEFSILNFSRNTRLYRESMKIKRNNGFWAYKCMIDSIIIGYQDSDLAAILVSLIAIVMVDDVEVMRLNRLPVRNLIQQSEILRSFERTKSIVSDSTREKQKFECNRCAIIVYIKLRYSLDASIFEASITMIQLLIVTSVSILIITVAFYRSRFENEARLFVAVSLSLFLVVNGILVACAFRLSKHSKELNRLIMALVDSLFEPLRTVSNESMSYDKLIPSHMFLITRRLIANQLHLVDRISIKLFGLTVDYGGVIRMNAIVISAIMLVLIYRR